MRDSGRKYHQVPTTNQAGFILPSYSFGEIGSGIACGCMPTIPQFFRHFYPEIKSRLSSPMLGRNTGSGQTSGYDKQSDRARAGSKGVTDHYVDLEGDSHPLKTCNAFGNGPRVWTDDISATSAGQGEQKGGA